MKNKKIAYNMRVPFLEGKGRFVRVHVTCAKVSCLLLLKVFSLVARGKDNLNCACAIVPNPKTEEHRLECFFIFLKETI